MITSAKSHSNLSFVKTANGHAYEFFLNKESPKVKLIYISPNFIMCLYIYLYIL